MSTSETTRMTTPAAASTQLELKYDASLAKDAERARAGGGHRPGLARQLGDGAHDGIPRNGRPGGRVLFTVGKGGRRVRWG